MVAIVWSLFITFTLLFAQLAFKRLIVPTINLHANNSNNDNNA